MRSKYFGAMLGLLCAAPLVAGAQNAGNPLVVSSAPSPQVTTQADGVHRIQMRDVPPSVMAWMIDPAHHPEPLMYAISRQALRNHGLSEAAFNRVATDIAAEIQRLMAERTGVAGQATLLREGELVTANDPQNTLLIWVASAQRAQEIAAIIATLDRPTRYVEIETQFVEVDDVAMQRFGALPAAAGKTAQKEFVGDFRSTLNEMIAAKHATVLSAPRLTVVNNLAASLGNVVMTPTDVSVGDKNQPEQNVTMLLSTRFGPVVIPTINADNTVSLALQVMKTRWLMPLVPADAKALTDPNFLPPQDAQPDAALFDTPTHLAIQARLRDGGTLVVSGLDSDAIRTMPADAAPPKAKPMLIFVTTRILHRADETIPGT